MISAAIGLVLRFMSRSSVRYPSFWRVLYAISASFLFFMVFPGCEDLD